jgi:hypothetical protein
VFLECTRAELLGLDDLSLVLLSSSPSSASSSIRYSKEIVFNPLGTVISIKCDTKADSACQFVAIDIFPIVYVPRIVHHR